MNCEACRQPITGEQLDNKTAYLHIEESTVRKHIAIHQKAHAELLTHTNGEAGVVTIGVDDLPPTALARWRWHHAQCDPSADESACRLTRMDELWAILKTQWVRVTDLGVKAMGEGWL